MGNGMPNALGNKRQRIKNEYRGQRWSDLPHDILVSIHKRLPLKDRIWTSSVCKNWRLATHGIKHGAKFPWLFLFKNRRSSPMPCYNVLYNPNSGGEYYVKDKTQHHKCDSRHGLRETMVMKSGWLLTRELCSCGLIYLYSPFTQEVVNLPTLPAEYLSPHKGKFKFSYCSESQRFVVYGALLTKRFQLISLIMWRTGDHVWEYDSFRVKPYCDEIVWNDIYRLELIKGALYFVFRTGTAWTLEFSFDNYQSMVLNHDKNIFLHDTQRLDFVVCEEEFFVVGSFDDGRREILRLDWLQKSWIKEVSLSKWVVFLGSCFSSLAPMLLVGENRKDLAGRLYYKEFEFRYDHFYDCHFCLYNDAVNAITPACLHCRPIVRFLEVTLSATKLLVHFGLNHRISDLLSKEKLHLPLIHGGKVFNGMEIHASVSVEVQHVASGNLRRCPRWRKLFRLIGWLPIHGWTIFEGDAVCVYQSLGRQASSCRFDVPVLLTVLRRPNFFDA